MFLLLKATIILTSSKRNSELTSRVKLVSISEKSYKAFFVLILDTSFDFSVSETIFNLLSSLAITVFRRFIDLLFWVSEKKKVSKETVLLSAIPSKTSEHVILFIGVLFNIPKTKVINFSTEVLPEALIPVNEITLLL